ncbi:hypothetical protein SODALDRAFT_16938 [Sodiomyces alkalinus F11]|uniref:Uncharacterized protein n=1 Tax=Sodiomyces alkalinus (strain CBS 110278 / VKM F-3762 / F11) TaxID=1314773 RepID=A0A3N2Q733_SODAK|nr:hypothetical protein SODALDRAFT_16938 [Sodiomyces alkalinus F11]ROT42497.1 hypothetical protein SODALDRAFT_16938 [Sodiomyces alkalinus F11]
MTSARLRVMEAMTTNPMSQFSALSVFPSIRATPLPSACDFWSPGNERRKSNNSPLATCNSEELSFGSFPLRGLSRCLRVFPENQITSTWTLRSAVGRMQYTGKGERMMWLTSRGLVGYQENTGLTKK